MTNELTQRSSFEKDYSFLLQQMATFQMIREYFSCNFDINALFVPWNDRKIHNGFFKRWKKFLLQNFYEFNSEMNKKDQNVILEFSRQNICFLVIVSFQTLCNVRYMIYESLYSIVWFQFPLRNTWEKHVCICYHKWKKCR